VLYADVQACYCPRPSMALERLSLSVEMEGHRPCAKKQQNLVPGAGSGPNVCRSGLIGWRQRDELAAAESKV
jgi:hypothetical protein